MMFKCIVNGMKEMSMSDKISDIVFVKFEFNVLHCASEFFVLILTFISTTLLNNFTYEYCSLNAVKAKSTKFTKTVKSFQSKCTKKS